jgi:hypothetical protein
MAERPDQIARHIESTRSELGSNLHELEDKVRQEADWKTHFERNPMTLLGLAFGGGVLLGSMIGGPSRRPVVAPREYQNGKPSGGTLNTQLSESWGMLKGALIGLAGEKVRDALNEALPGFAEHYDKIERGNSAPVSHTGTGFESPVHRM